MAWLLVADGDEVVALQRRRNDYGHGDFVRGRYGDCAAITDTMSPNASALRSSTGCFDVESSVHAISNNCFLQ